MKDFRLNDKVFHPRHGNGKIIAVDMESKRPFKALFNGRCPRAYSGAETNMWDRLYHGHDPEVIVNEQAPERKKNLFLNIMGSPGAFEVTEHDSVISARENACVVQCAVVGIKIEVDI